MVPDIDLPDVKDGQVEVAREVVADKDVLATVTVEGLGNPHPFPDTPQHFLEVGILSLIILSVDGVILLAPTDGPAFPGN